MSSFYRNILFARLNHRKRDHFFKEMSKRIKRSSSQCKSKFQKQEIKIFINHFKIPESHYEYFSFLREQRKFFKDNKINLEEDIVKNPKALFKWMISEKFLKMKKQREEIYEEIIQQNLKIFLKQEEIGNTSIILIYLYLFYFILHSFLTAYVFIFLYQNPPISFICFF